MPPLEDRRYSISEVSEKVGVPAYVLRQWEKRIPELRPKRDRANRRYYLPADIDIARRIHQLVHDEKVSLAGARIRLKEELAGEGRPRTRQEAIDLADKIEAEVRRLLDLLDNI
jgi:DNA-binding transcriptional MerR regulator